MKLINPSLIFSICFFLLYCLPIEGQNTEIKWYSESFHNGITIQNSFPKGGPYHGAINEHYNYSYLVFYSQVINDTETPIELSVDFSADPFPIPNSPNTFVKLFLPTDTMTFDKVSSFSYGITELESLEKPTSLKRKVKPKEDCLFYVVAIFYQTNAGAFNQERGGNRAELVMEGNVLYYNLLPQVDSLPCGKIIHNK